MNNLYDRAFDLLMINEGGYVCDPHDKGGETKFGISKKAYPHEDICNLTLERAKEIYKRDYWDRCKCDFLPPALAVAVFDFAVNSGVKRAIRYLQNCFYGVKVDGIIGNQTIAACNRVPPKRILDVYIEARFEFLQSLKDFKHFGRGWTNRVERVRKFCEELI